MLIGDVIIAARTLIPDMPQVLPPPSGVPTAAVVTAIGSTLPPGNYFLLVTFRTPWGETLASAEAGPLTVGASQGIQITAPAIPPSGSVIRAYLTLPNGASGSEQQFIESATVPFTISTPPPSTGLPPSRNSAFLADTDGLRMFSASTLYSWLNDGLARLARLCGGIQDYTGASSIAGQPLYQLTGEWNKIQAIWYDGYPLGLGNQSGFFRRNSITSSVLTSAAVSVRDNRVIIEVFYQPVRTAGASTLSAPVAITDTVATVTLLAGFQTFGPPMFAQIGTEIVAFSAIAGSQLTNLVRGIGGTTPSAWPIGTPVKELNIWVLGKRLHTQQYQPGNAGNVLPLPIGWGEALKKYILSMAREAEQEDQKAQRLMKEFDEAAQGFLRANRQLAGPTQVGGSSYGPDTVPGFGTEFGGVILQ